MQDSGAPFPGTAGIRTQPQDIVCTGRTACAAFSETAEGRSGQSGRKIKIQPAETGEIPEKIHKETEKKQTNTKIVRTLFFKDVNVFSPPEACEIRAEKQEKPTYCACKKK